MVSFSAEKPSLPRRHLFASLVALVLSAVFLGSGTVTGGAQTGDESGDQSGEESGTGTTSTTIDLAAEKERVEAAEAAKAREVDAANAQLGDLTVCPGGPAGAGRRPAGPGDLRRGAAGPGRAGGGGGPA